MLQTHDVSYQTFDVCVFLILAWYLDGTGMHVENLAMHYQGLSRPVKGFNHNFHIFSSSFTLLLVIRWVNWSSVTYSTQDGLTGSAWGDWANYTASPLRAFENELGVQAPVGFWDPAGLSSDGSVEDFKRRRQTELKHGRISMLATMGYITPEITGKFPGYLSPSAGLKFADVPNGLAAISKVPAAGWGQILAYMAFCEVSQDQSAGTPAAAGDFGWKLITSTDPEVKKTKLNAELANGRLAMMAIIGMFFQVMKSEG